MYSDYPKIQPLLKLGRPHGRYNIWPDYIAQYGFTLDDVPSLLTLFGDDEINSLGSSRLEIWAPLYAWRILGQLRSEEAIEPIIASFDTLFDDDYALSELGVALGLIGSKAIQPLTDHLQQAGKDEFSYVLAIDALGEIAKAHPACRTEVLEVYREYMARPIETAYALNGLLIVRLLDLDATETIDEIRRLFNRGCVDITCAGDLEEVEIILGFRTERSTPRPNFAKLHGMESPLPFLQADEDLQTDEDDTCEIIEHWLTDLGCDESILDVSELDGYFAAIACAPQVIVPSTWMPAIWGGEAFAPEWQSQKDVEQFTHALFNFYNTVMGKLQEGFYEPIFLQTPGGDHSLLIVDEWCEGFLRGLGLWGEMSPEDMRYLEKYLYPIRYFGTDEGLPSLETMTDAEILHLQESIAPNVEKLHRHFFKPADNPTTTFIRAAPKVGRNEPCPCGSGKKYKKCCGLN